MLDSMNDNLLVCPIVKEEKSLSMKTVDTTSYTKAEVIVPAGELKTGDVVYFPTTASQLVKAEDLDAGKDYLMIVPVNQIRFKQP